MINPGLRQVHLDFHTSGSIEPIAANFDAASFAQTLVEADVTSVNVFAKCHHGYSYYPTKVGTIHPGLGRDLLGEQLSALKASGIAAPVYVSVLWDDLAGLQHPEWVAAGIDGGLLARPPFSAESVLEQGRGWTVMDLATPYADYVAAQVSEICERYAPDGFWFDIVSVVPSYTPASIARLQASGVDPSDQGAAEEYFLGVRNAFIERLSCLIRGYLPEASIVYNHTVDSWVPQTVECQTQLDVESLPTSGSAWGYTHYPVYARYARTFGLPIVGMTGRFHRSWADFGGLKTNDQLRYEISTISAAGGGVSVGDQLDPSGVLDSAVYRTIGTAFKRIKDLEPWLVDAVPSVEAAVIASWVDGSRDPGRCTRALSRGVNGACQILGEMAVQYDVLDAMKLEPGRYKLVVVADDVALSADESAVLERAIEAGAAVLIAGKALFDDAGGPLLRQAPAVATGVATTVPGFFRVESLALTEPGELDAEYAYVSYGQAVATRPIVGADVVGHVLDARFNRRWDHFSSHGHAPVSDVQVGPLISSTESVTHIALPIFSDYAEYDYWVNGDIIRRCISRLLPKRIVSHDGPPWVEASVMCQPASGSRGARSVVHLVAFQSRRISTSVPRVDRGHALAGFTIRVAVDSTPTAVYLAPSRKSVPFHYLDGIAIVEPDVVEPATVLVIETGSAAESA